MIWPFRRTDDRPEWDSVFARELQGATMLVGITYDEPGGERLEQFFGTVMSADPSEGVTLRLNGGRAGESYTLPPDLRAIVRARPGSYLLRETGEEVVDPDYTSTWVIKPPAH